MIPSVLVEAPLNNRRVSPEDNDDVAKYLVAKSYYTSTPPPDVQLDVGGLPVEEIKLWVNRWKNYSPGYAKNDQKKLGKLVKVENRPSRRSSTDEMSYEYIGIEGGRRFVEFKRPGDTLAVRYWYQVPQPELPDGVTSLNENKAFRESLETSRLLPPPPVYDEFTVTNGKADNLNTIPECLIMACLLETHEVAVLPSEQAQVDKWIKHLKLDEENHSTPYSTYRTAGYLDGHGFVTYTYTERDGAERTRAIFRTNNFSSHLVDARYVEKDESTSPAITEEKDPWWIQMKLHSGLGDNNPN
jgi:hypothetical protein